ncbi:unnamed protein product, partial [Vitis vinifera]
MITIYRVKILPLMLKKKGKITSICVMFSDSLGVIKLKSYCYNCWLGLVIVLAYNYIEISVFVTCQGLFGEFEKVKWRGTWVVKTVIRRQIYDDQNTLLRELRHPNILQFLGSIVHGEEMILITEHLSKVGFIMNLLCGPFHNLIYGID